jgi:serine acetyltransferase
VSIAGHITVGVGGVVVRDLAEPGVYVGVPVRRLHKPQQ